MPFLAMLILGTIIILKKQAPFRTDEGFVFGTVYKITYQSEDNLKEEIETEYGVDGIVREKKNGFSGKFTISVGIGVVLCILSCVPLMLCAGINAKDDIVVISVSILLLIVAVAVNLFVRVGIVNSSFDVLLQEGDYTVKKKKEAPVVGAVMLVYWLIFVAIYLGWSFPTGKWDISWVVWPIAGVLSPIVALITRMFVNKKEK